MSFSVFSHSQCEPLRDFVQNLLFDFNVPPHLNGFDFFTDAVILRYCDPSCNLTDIYSAIASANGVAMKTVSNSMTYAASASDGVLCSALNIDPNSVTIGKIVSAIALIVHRAADNGSLKVPARDLFRQK